MDDKLIEKIEALLFASGKALSVESLMGFLEYDNKKNVNSSLKKLKESYDQKKSPLMVVEQDDAWKLTVREEFLPLVRKIVADTELPKTVLETLAVIAWKSPVLQSNVIKVRTNKAYEHVDLLERLGFITRKKEGRSFKISLSEKFYEYFDVEHGDIRKMFKDVKGIEKELEEEQKKHENSRLPSEENNSENDEIREEINHDLEVSQAIDAEKPHLGSLEVVDAISEDTPNTVEIVDSISNQDDENSEDCNSELSDEREIDEVLDDLDQEEEAKKEIDSILED